MIWTHESGPADAPLVVLVHGSMDRSASMVKLARLLVDDFRVVRYDRRGYGRSKPHPGPFTMEHQVADLGEVIQGREAAVVFGHSFGGNVALAAASRQVGLCQAVVTFESPLSWLEWWPGTTRRWDPAADPADVAERFMRRMVGDAAWARLGPTVQNERRAEGGALLAEIVDLASRPPWSPDRVTVPVRTMFGSTTAAHHRQGAEHVAGLLSDRPAVCVEGAGHNGPYTHPGAVAAVVRQLAGEVTPRSMSTWSSPDRPA